MTFADPCIRLIVVTPPASAWYMATSFGSIDSLIVISAVTGDVASFVETVFKWECASIIPGITTLPVASMTGMLPGADSSWPIPWIIPFTMYTSVLGKSP